MSLGEHLSKAGPAAPFGRFDICEFAGHDDPAVQGVLTQQLLLCGDGKAVLFLFFRRDSGVKDGGA